VLRTLVLCGALLLSACGEAKRPDEAKQPDVLLVVLDTTRADALSAYGNPRATSPNLDAFARGAAVFDAAFTTAASTGPALAALMSGRLPHYDERLVWNRSVAHGMGRFFPGGTGSGLAPGLVTLAERFREAGYRTAGFVTNPYVKRIYHFDQGFDRYDEIFQSGPVRYGLGEQVVDRALEALAQTDEPLFVYLHFMDAHDPYLPPAEHRDAFAFETLPGMDDMALNRAWFDDAGPRGESGRVMASHARGLYDASVRYLDAQLGRLLEALEARPDALVAIVGDHGEEFLEHGGNRHRGTLYDELLHVPVLMRIPGVPAQRIDALVRHFDVGATLLDYAGLAPIPDADAVSLRPFLEGAPDAPELVAVGSFPAMRGPLRPRRWFVRGCAAPCARAAGSCATRATS
jgi:arylsulfatase A-like enzyme